MAQLIITKDEIRPIVEAVVTEVLGRRKTDEEILSVDRLAFPEREAAGLIGVNVHVLRDARYRGELRGRKVGKSWVYTRKELLQFLEEFDQR